MKKVYTVIAMFVFVEGFAQPTLTQANNLSIGDFIQSGVMYSTLAPNIQQGVAGPSQSWNFTTTSFDVMDTIIGVPVPPQYAATFPTSNIGIDNGSMSQDYSFCTAGSSGFYFDGGVYIDPNFGPQAYAYSNSITNLMWPMTYNTTFVDTGYSDWKFPSSGPYDSTWQIFTMVETVSADAWGTLTLTWGTETVLRVKRELSYSVMISEHDSVTGWGPFTSFNSQGLIYEFWSPNYSWSLASLDCDPTADTVMSYTIATAITEGVTDLVPVQTFNLYPIPAYSTISLAGEVNSEWEISDGTGRIVSRGVMQNEIVEINIDDLAQGIYVMSVTDENGIRSSRKFVVR